MKKSVFIAMVMASTVAVAAPPKSDPFCKRLGQVARTTMQVRQDGADLSEMMQIANDTKVAMFREMTLEAYQYPVINHAELMAKTVRDFGVRWEVLCYRMESRK